MPSLDADRELLRRLLAENTVSARSNLGAVALLEEHFAGHAIRTERVPSADGTKANLLAWTGPDFDASRNGLVLCGHLDVVPADEPEWTSDPFTLVDRGERWVGRGTCDMKGFVALAANLLVRTSQRTLRAPLAVLFTYDEEVGSLGAERFAAVWPRDRPLPRDVVIGEPTDGHVVRMHKGHAKVRIEVLGRSAHSGSPHLGVNAIDAAVPVLAALGEVRDAWATERGPAAEHFPEVPFVALNIAKIRAGDALNVIPERCTIYAGFRPLPGDRTEALLGTLEDAARAAGPAGTTVTLLNDNPAMALDADRPLHRELCALIGQDDSVGVSFSSDAGMLQRDLAHDCVLYGPGSITVAHRPDEFVPVAEIETVRGVLERFIGARCGEGGP